MRFTEIEHKFIVDDSFDSSKWCVAARQLRPTKETQLVVTDTYYVLKQHPHVILRHRHDSELQQLTLKTFGKDNESRVEIDLQLDQQAGNQAEAVTTLVGHLGPCALYSLTKAIHVFHFSDCEIVYYQARGLDEPRRHVGCVEFEAKHPTSHETAIATIRRYELLFGFDEANRSQQTLLELLYPGCKL